MFSFVTNNSVNKAFAGAVGAVCAVGGSLLFRKLYWSCYRRYFKIPAGPVGYPIIGSLPNLYLNTIQYMQSMSNKYGDICSLYIGYNNIILLNNTKLLKQIYSNKHFIHRPTKPKQNRRVNRKVRPFPFINGDEWKLRRKNFSTCIITMLESKKINKIICKVLKENIFVEINKRITDHKNGIMINDLCHSAVFNTLYYAAFGSQISMNDKNYQLIKNWTETIFAEKDAFDPGRFNKTFRYMMGLYDNKYKTKTEQISNAIKNKKSIFFNLIKHKLDTFNENKLDGFIDYMIFNTNKNDKITLDMLIDDIGTVFTAGTDTTSAMIEACMYNFVLYPKLQKLIYDELLKCVIANNNNNDKSFYFQVKMQLKCPLFRAFIHESMRLHGGVISPARTCTKDTYINHKNKTHLIPKNSIVILSSPGATLNTKSNIETWGHNVDKFNMYRFLQKKSNSNEYKFKYNDSFHIFSFGKRDCPGRSLAMKDIVLIVANLLLNYQFKPYNNDMMQFTNDFVNNKKIYSVYKFDPALKLTIINRYKPSPVPLNLLQKSITTDALECICTA